jgi:hypothetical protein
MIAALIFFVGIVITSIGGLTMIACAMPSFGGSRGNETATFIFGAVLFIVGLVITFYAGTWV